MPTAGVAAAVAISVPARYGTMVSPRAIATTTTASLARPGRWTGLVPLMFLSAGLPMACVLCDGAPPLIERDELLVLVAVRTPRGDLICGTHGVNMFVEFDYVLILMAFVTDVCQDRP